MKLNIINESGGFIKHSKPSTEKVKLPLSAYGNQPLTTFNSKDQDSAMNYWKDILKHFNKKTKISEGQEVVYLGHTKEGELDVAIKGKKYKFLHVEYPAIQKFIQAAAKNDRLGYSALRSLEKQVPKKNRMRLDGEEWTQLEEQEMISEIPWIDVGGDDVIDLELEKITDPDEALSKIRSLIDALPRNKQFKFRSELMNNYGSYLEKRFNISFRDIGPR